MEKSQAKGKAHAIASVFFIATSFVTISIMSREVGPELTLLLWFMFASISSIAILIYTTKSANSLGKYLKEGIVLGLANAITCFFWVLAIDNIGSNMTAFFIRISTIVTIILSIIILKERIRAKDIVAVVLAIAGGALITLRTADLVILGAVFAIISAFAIGAQQIIEKKYVEKIKPIELSGIRTFYTFMLLLPLTLALGKVHIVSGKILLIAAVGSLLSAVIGFLLWYKALKEIPVNQATIIRTLEPFVVIAYSFIIFSEIPTQIELIGGLLIVAGVVLSQIKVY